MWRVKNRKCVISWLKTTVRPVKIIVNATLYINFFCFTYLKTKKMLNKKNVELVLTKIPPELLYHVAEHLDFDEQMELSSFTGQRYKRVKDIVKILEPKCNKFPKCLQNKHSSFSSVHLKINKDKAYHFSLYESKICSFSTFTISLFSGESVKELYQSKFINL